MFKPHIGRCSCGCNKDGLVVVKKGYIKQCNERIKKEAKAKLQSSKVSAEDLLKQMSEHRYKRPRKPTGELEMFKQIWNDRPHVCQVTGELIRRFDVACFSHLLPKSTFSKYRLNPDNVWLVTPQVHHRWETTDRSDPMFDQKKKERERLRQQYHQEHGY